MNDPLIQVEILQYTSEFSFHAIAEYIFYFWEKIPQTDFDSIHWKTFSGVFWRLSLLVIFVNYFCLQ